jgi:hypothetical protein
MKDTIIKKAMDERGMTPQDLITAMQPHLPRGYETSRQSVSAWRLGKSRPTSHFAIAISEVLGLDLKDVIAG